MKGLYCTLIALSLVGCEYNKEKNVEFKQITPEQKTKIDIEESSFVTHYEWISIIYESYQLLQFKNKIGNEYQFELFQNGYSLLCSQGKCKELIYSDFNGFVYNRERFQNGKKLKILQNTLIDIKKGILNSDNIEKELRKRGVNLECLVD